MFVSPIIPQPPPARSQNFGPTSIGIPQSPLDRMSPWQFRGQRIGRMEVSPQRDSLPGLAGRYIFRSAVGPLITIFEPPTGSERSTISATSPDNGLPVKRLPLRSIP